MRKTAVYALLAAGMLATGASAAVWDFQSETVGAAPSSGVVFISNEDTAVTQAKIVNSSSSPADPFGGAGNKSLWMQDTAGTNATVTFGTGGAGTGYAQGTMSAKIYVVDDATNTYQYVDINGGTGAANTGAGDIGPWIQYIPDDYAFRAITSAGTIYFTNPFPHNQVVDLAVQFNTATDTFTATINGVPLTDGTNTTFNFFNNLSELTSVRIVHAMSVDRPQSTTFYDNVTLVPEPSSMALIGLGALALARRVRRA